MPKIKRRIIKIDEEKCNGCGFCLPACPEGALQIINGKAKLVKEGYCDGLGACLGECPQGALRIEEREADAYDTEGVIAHLQERSPELLEKHLGHLAQHAGELSGGPGRQGRCSCPSEAVLQWEGGGEGPAEGPDEKPAQAGKNYSELRQWPIQLHLVPPFAPYFQNSDLILAADCVPFAYANFHQDFLKGKAIAIGCPKLDDAGAYRQKVEQILEHADLKSITVVRMEVPCCYGLVHLVREAIDNSGKDVPLETVTIGIKGEIQERTAVSR